MSEFQIHHLNEMDLKHKKIFMRVDFNVPIKDGHITDPHRIHKALPSIRYILRKGGHLVLASHLGRPTKHKKDDFSLRPVAEYLTETLGFEVLFVEEPDSELPQILLKGLKENQLILLENLRFHPGEIARDRTFAEKLASYTDIYVNEGFSISHRDHTSITLLPELIPERCIGFHFQKEIKELDRIRLNAPSPFFVILGGSKVNDKIPLLNSLVDQADEFFIGGVIAYTFLKAQGVNVGNSLVETNVLNAVSDFIERLKLRGKPLWLPKDHFIVKDLKKPYQIEITQGDVIKDGYQGMDIGPRTQESFCKEIKRCQSLFWNGPLGFFEQEAFSKGTALLAKSIGEHKDAHRVVGGGHSALAVRGLEDDINYVSTGGGASLHYLQGSSIPGMNSISVLKRDPIQE